MTKSFAIRRRAARLAALAAAVFACAGAPFAASANEAGPALPSAQVDLTNRASLQRGAGLYMNYCAGCHSLNYHRYSRTAQDLGLTEEQVEQNLIFDESRIGATMATGLDPAQGEKWMGKAPPDLSVVARTKHEGADWIYAYLKSFYIDESRPTGWNNTVFPGASMPNVLWEMQGVQHLVPGAHPAAGQHDAETTKDEGAASDGKPVTPGHGAASDTTGEPAAGLADACKDGEKRSLAGAQFCIPAHQMGQQSAAEFDRTARDISAFLAYVGEPAQMKRESMGVWVVLFLAFLTFLTYLLKSEYWRDVH